MTNEPPQPLPGAELLAEVIDRARDPDRYERWLELVKHAGYCRRPVRLRGGVSEADLSTGELRSRYTTAAEPDGVLLKACGNRRAAACPSCSAAYKGDAWQLVAAGLRGGKGVPESVATHPMVFATFTAPGFGPVHTLPDPSNPRGVCRRRGADERCAHGRPAGCWQRHTEDDPRLGDPICPECFDYAGAVIWNALAPELWRRTTIYIRRALARITGISQKRLAHQVRLSYTKVAEYQRRGVLHFHAVIRLDGANDFSTPPNQFTADRLEEAIRTAAADVAVPHPLGRAPIRWGEQLHMSRIEPDGETTPEAAAAYLAKYATKSAEDLGLDSPATPREHIARLREAAHRLAELPELDHLALARAAESIGFRGHWSSRSRRYSTTFTALRQARAKHAKAAAGHRDEPGTRVGADWRYVGIGYATAGDTWLAATAGNARREQRQVGKLELGTDPRETG
jgi:hypothetical protein